MGLWSIISLDRKGDWRSSDNINPVSEKDPELKKEVNFTVTDDTVI